MQVYDDDLVDAIMEIWDECESEISAKEEAERLNKLGLSQQVVHDSEPIKPTLPDWCDPSV